MHAARFVTAVMNAAKPIIVVVHATSKQGTSVINSLLQTDKFAVKATTHDANSESAPADTGVCALALQRVQHAVGTYAQ